MAYIYLNLGCGKRTNPDWVNIDILPHSPEVVVHDLTSGIPFPNDSCDAVYHSNFIEHLRCDQAYVFMNECYRVLKPGGVLRVATPDLETICRLYLANLEKALSDPTTSHPDYEWTILELFDQMVRERSGGSMIKYLKQQPLPNKEFVLSRIGEEGQLIIASLQQEVSFHPQPSNARILVSRLFHSITNLRLLLGMSLIGKKNKIAMGIGQFRLSGEVHQWMYDRYSLAQLFIQAGFRQPSQQACNVSTIPGWENFFLDNSPDGSARKPDSFYMEGIKAK